MLRDVYFLADFRVGDLVDGDRNDFSVIQRQMNQEAILRSLGSEWFYRRDGRRDANLLFRGVG